VKLVMLFSNLKVHGYQESEGSFIKRTTRFQTTALGEKNYLLRALKLEGLC